MSFQPPAGALSCLCGEARASRNPVTFVVAGTPHVAWQYLVSEILVSEMNYL